MLLLLTNKLYLFRVSPALLQRAHVAHNQQFPLLNATLIIIKPFPRQLPLLCSLLSSLPDAGTSLSLSLFSCSSCLYHTNHISSRHSHSILINFYRIPAVCQREGAGEGRGRPLWALFKGKSFINSRLAKSTRPCAAIHQTALASVTQLHRCCCCCCLFVPRRLFDLFCSSFKPQARLRAGYVDP